MKTNKLTLALAGLMIASAALVSSCSKKDTTTPTPKDTNGSTASDNTQAEQQSNDAENIGAEAVDNGQVTTFRLGSNSEGGGGLLSPMSGSVSVTGFGTGIVTVTFNQFVGMDGKTRNGSIIYTMSPVGAHYRDPNMVMTVSTTTANPYSVNSNTITLSKTVTNNGLVAAGGNMQWTITSNLSIAKAGGGTYTWNANRTHVLLNTNAATYDGISYGAAYNGASTPINWASTSTVTPNGVIMEINGSASGTAADGAIYNVTTTNVVRNHNCTPDASRPHFHPFVAGTVDFTPSGKTTRIIDYGNGGCDMTYTISIGSWSETITW